MALKFSKTINFIIDEKENLEKNSLKNRNK